MPNYRFYYLLQKAVKVCSEIKALGNAFLSAKEKKDSEALAKLRAKHESNIHNLTMEVKKQQLEEAQKALDALWQSRRGPESRMRYYLRLIGLDPLFQVPTASAAFVDFPNQIEKPIDEGGLKLVTPEKEEMDKAKETNDIQEDVGRMQALAGILHVIPDVEVKVQPIGVGAGLRS